jgi:hypothetical protein
VLDLGNTPSPITGKVRWVYYKDPSKKAKDRREIDMDYCTSIREKTAGGSDGGGDGSAAALGPTPAKNSRAAAASDLTFEVGLYRRIYTFRAVNQETKLHWCSALRKAGQPPPDFIPPEAEGIMQGFMEKQSQFYTKYQASKMWQRRWFILDHIGLRYCRNPICPMQYTRAIPIGYRTTVMKYVHPKDEFGHCIMIKFDGNAEDFDTSSINQSSHVSSTGTDMSALQDSDFTTVNLENPVVVDSSSQDVGPRRIILRCDSKHECDQWLEALLTLVEKHASGTFRERYKTKKLLGRGHSGQVFMAERVSDKHLCAVKVVKLTGAKRAKKRELALLELAMLSTLKRCPSVVQLEEADEDKDYIYVVMELCRGGDLLQLLMKHGPLQENVVVGIMKSLFKALVFIHSMHVCHGDLKLDNILLRSRFYFYFVVPT